MDCLIRLINKVKLCETWPVVQQHKHIINQSIISLLITYQAVKQHEHQDRTSRTARNQVHLWLPL